MGSSGWMMHAAARSAYYNRESKADWEQTKREREEVGAFILKIIFRVYSPIVALAGVALIAALTMAFGPAIWVMPGLGCLSAVYFLSVWKLS